MNANELADWLDNTTNSEDWGELAKYYKWCKENVAPMLRQQQAEIEVLKAKLDYMFEQELKTARLNK